MSTAGAQTASRHDTIAAVLRRPILRRPIVAHELRERIVRGSEPGSTVTAWTATVPQLAEAIDTALQKDTRGGIQPPAGGSTARTEILTVLCEAGHNAAAAADLLGRAFLESHAPPAETPTHASLDPGHALVIEHSSGDLCGVCECGRRLGLVPPRKPLDGLVALWERHTSTEVHR